MALNDGIADFAEPDNSSTSVCMLAVLVWMAEALLRHMLCCAVLCCDRAAGRTQSSTRLEVALALCQQQ
jgi:hypothetical protein